MGHHIDSEGRFQSDKYPDSEKVGAFAIATATWRIRAGELREVLEQVQAGAHLEPADGGGK